MKNWKKTPPKKEGWYWVMFTGKHGLTCRPGLVINIVPERNITMVDTGRGTFIFGRSKEEEKRQGDIHFGPFITPPEFPMADMSRCLEYGYTHDTA